MSDIRDEIDRFETEKTSSNDELEQLLASFKLDTSRSNKEKGPNGPDDSKGSRGSKLVKTL